MTDVDAVVVGAGSFGASITYHLAARGRHVALVDQFGLVSQTSPRAAGLTSLLNGNPIMGELTRRSVEKIVGFAEETGEPLACHRSGSLTVARTPRLARQLDGDIEQTRRTGPTPRRVSAAEAAEHAPFLDARGASAVVHTPEDVFLEPGDLPRAYLRAAERLGAELRPHTTVHGVRFDGSSVTHVETDRGDIRTPVVVDAAGAWAPRLAAAAGLRAPLVPTRHQLYVTEPIDGITPDHAIVRVLEARVYVRPERGGLMLGGYESEPVQHPAEELAADFSIDDLDLDVTPLRELTAEVAGEFPVLQNAPVRLLRGGLPTMTADGRFLVDAMPGVDGFFLASGCCVAGLSNSPAVGEAVAHWITDGRPPIDMSPFSIRRFGTRFDGDERALRDACHRVYASSYSG